MRSSCSKNAIALIIASLAVVCPSVGRAQQAASPAHTAVEHLRSQVVFWLSGYHGGPTRAQLDALGTPAHITAELRRLAGDAALRPTLRLRALDALGLYSDAATTAFVRRVVDAPRALAEHHPRVAALLRQHALLSYARIRGPASVAQLARFVGADDLQLRLTAVVALGRYGGAAGRDQLQALRAHIDDPVVFAKVNKFVDTASK